MLKSRTARPSEIAARHGHHRYLPRRLVTALVTSALIITGLLVSTSSTIHAQTPAAPATQPAATPAPVPPAATPPPAPVSAPAPAPAAPVLPPEIFDPVERISKNVENAEKSIQQLKEIEGELSRLRGDVETIIYESTATADHLRPQLEEVKRQIAKLGPPPAKDQPPESATISAERTRLNQQSAGLDGAIKTTELAWVRAKQLIDRITVIRYQQFTKNLFERRSSPVLPQVWREVADRLPSLSSRMSYYGSDWLQWAGQQMPLLGGAALASLLAYILLTALGRRWIRPALATPSHSPTFFERAGLAAWAMPLAALPAVIAACTMYAAFDSAELLFGPWGGPASAIFEGILVFAFASALLTAALRPNHPYWRLVPVSSKTAHRLRWLLRAFIAVYVIDTILIEFARLLYAPLSVTVALSFLTSLLFFALLVWLLLTPFEPQSGESRPVNGKVHVDGPISLLRPRWIKIPLWLMAFAILLFSVAGYVALGRFIAHQLVLSGIVLATAGLAYLAIRAATRDRANGPSPLSSLLETRLGLEPNRRRQFNRLSEFTGTLLLLAAATPLLLLQWGYSFADIRDWSKALLFGFEIGQFRISLARILLGIALFVGLLFFTRLVQKWLRDDMLAQPRMDPGIANSIETSVGYLGTGLAAILAVSYAGFDVTSLAIVAGALSVGIGFGLQSIVNNFVSGLILLVERPIKVGDWIVVGNEQGNVRRISVRSTEIETFDRASLIVPNAELISGRVLNWTHRNILGRVLIKIPLLPVADPDAVIAILIDVAKTHPQVVENPAPSATLDSIAPTAYEFTLRATLADVTTGVGVQSQIRLEILRRLREAGLYSTPTVVTSFTTSPQAGAPAATTRN